MRIMGIDPGYAIVGVGLVDYDNVRFSLVEYGAITTPAELSFETRLRQIYDDMVGLRRCPGHCHLPWTQWRQPPAYRRPGGDSRRQPPRQTHHLQGEENMIYSISGLLRQVAPTYCVVEACGVGYQCSASTHTLSSLPGRGQEVTLLTHLWVKEDGMELFGFSTEQERRCFRMLIGVSGVGPRVALAILSDSAPDRLMLSIAAGDAKALTRAQGVGAKLAQRIILELRDKVSDEDISMPFSDEIGTISTVAETIHNTAKSEAISALVALGYGQTDAAAVIAPMEDSLAVDELIRRALKSFTRGK